ncbi:serine-rich adhesin for platelets-like [Saccostrea cucullata]|uniref:serine-rich adhesin for platelets-like n=1 Tax=Saccostrea cuccullata TaxID=36930 RepID=UPI002ED0E71F
MDLLNVIGYLFLTIFVEYATTLKHFGNYDEDLTYGRVHHLFPTSRWRRRTNWSPPRPSLFVEVEGRPLRLSLTLNQRLSGCVMVYPQRENICSKEEKVDLYQDPLHEASIEIQTSAAGRYSLSGTFIFGHHHYFMKTVTSIKSFHQVSRVPFMISKITTSSDLRSDYIILNPKTLNYKPLRRDLPIRHKRSGTVYTVELFLTVDYSIYKFWYEQNNNISSSGERRNAAINDIKQYYAFLLNGVDARYKNLPGSTDTINVIFAGIYIAETAASWSGSLDSLNRLDAMSAGDAFEKWRTSQVNSNSIPDHDHAMLFTRYNLALHNQTAATGFAYVSSVCSEGSISLVEEKFDLISYTVAAHELGHSLGATHEGVGTNTCPDEGYVMSAVSRPHDKSTNPWRFSSCSVSQIANYINSLSPNCLLQETSSVDRNSLQTFESIPLGQKYQADQQCELSFGAGALTCREFYNSSNYQEICTTLYCKGQGSTGCDTILPADGTTCGNRKWCQNGVCTYNSSSPAADETCLFGDEPGTVCTQIKSNSWDCYGNDYRKCCHSCESIRSSDANCPFGDRAPGCSFLTTDNRIHCYDLDTYSECCGSCKNLSTNISGCEYGDRVENCDAQNSCSGQQASTNCCATCNKVVSTTTSRTGTSGTTITSTTTSTSQSTTPTTISTTTSTSEFSRTTKPVTTTQSPTSTAISTTSTHVPTTVTTPATTKLTITIYTPYPTTTTTTIATTATTAQSPTTLLTVSTTTLSSTHVPTTVTTPAITTSYTTKHTTTTTNPTTKLTTTTPHPTTTSTTTAKTTTTAQSPRTSTITTYLSPHIGTTTPAKTTNPTTKHPSNTTTAQIPTATSITTTTFPSPTTSTITTAASTSAQTTTRPMQTTSTKATLRSTTITKEATTMLKPTTEITTAAKPTIKSTTTAAKTTSITFISTTDAQTSSTPLVFTPTESDSTTTESIQLATPRNLAPGEETPIIKEPWFVALVAVLGVIFGFVLFAAFLYALRKKYQLSRNSLKLHKKHVSLGYENHRYSSSNLFEIPPEIDKDVDDEYNEIPYEMLYREHNKKMAAISQI